MHHHVLQKHTLKTSPQKRPLYWLKLATYAALAALLNLIQTAWLSVQFQHGIAQAESLPPASKTFIVNQVRPEAYSWYWDNVDAKLFRGAQRGNKSFQWLKPPTSPEHLGYSQGAQYRTTAVMAGHTRTVEVSYLPYTSIQNRVASDNALGRKPYSFVAQRVTIDGRHTFDVLVQYTASGRTFSDTQFHIEIITPAMPLLAQAYVTHLTDTLQGLSSHLMKDLDERYFNAVLKKRGSYTINSRDRQFNVTLTVVQEIKGITPEMLAWWWDHIGNTSRYKLWQPIDHITFEWKVAPTHPDLAYDIGAKQRVKEQIGPWAMTLDITGADPHVSPPPVPTGTNNFFYADTDLSLLANILPSNKLIHRWTSNAAGDGVILTSIFVNTALAQLINFNFFNDLGSHALREFQMLPYFLPRLYKREHLGQ